MTAFEPKESDELAAPAVFAYLGGVVAYLFAALAVIFFLNN